jgi:hypothetical protein
LGLGPRAFFGSLANRDLKPPQQRARVRHTLGPVYDPFPRRADDQPFARDVRKDAPAGIAGGLAEHPAEPQAPMLLDERLQELAQIAFRHNVSPGALAALLSVYRTAFAAVLERSLSRSARLRSTPHR